MFFLPNVFNLSRKHRKSCLLEHLRDEFLNKDRFGSSSLPERRLGFIGSIARLKWLLSAEETDGNFSALLHLRWPPVFLSSCPSANHSRFWLYLITNLWDYPLNLLAN